MAAFVGAELLSRRRDRKIKQELRDAKKVFEDEIKISSEQIQEGRKIAKESRDKVIENAARVESIDSVLQRAQYNKEKRATNKGAELTEGSDDLLPDVAELTGVEYPQLTHSRGDARDYDKTLGQSSRYTSEPMNRFESVYSKKSETSNNQGLELRSQEGLEKTKNSSPEVMKNSKSKYQPKQTSAYADYGHYTGDTTSDVELGSMSNQQVYNKPGVENEMCIRDRFTRN